MIMARRIAFICVLFVVCALPALCEENCTYSSGYWKNHEDQWPVQALVIGDVTYTKVELLDILTSPARGDATYNLAHQLIAVKLNITNGADESALGANV